MFFSDEYFQRLVNKFCNHKQQPSYLKKIRTIASPHQLRINSRFEIVPREALLIITAIFLITFKFYQICKSLLVINIISHEIHFFTFSFCDYFSCDFCQLRANFGKFTSARNHDSASTQKK